MRRGAARRRERDVRRDDHGRGARGRPVPDLRAAPARAARRVRPGGQRVDADALGRGRARGLASRPVRRRDADVPRRSHLRQPDRADLRRGRAQGAAQLDRPEVPAARRRHLRRRADRADRRAAARSLRRSGLCRADGRVLRADQRARPGAGAGARRRRRRHAAALVRRASPRVRRTTSAIPRSRRSATPSRPRSGRASRRCSTASSGSPTTRRSRTCCTPAGRPAILARESSCCRACS